MHNIYNIYIVGFMGTGKTSVSQEIADKLGYTFSDIDTNIADKAGMSIPEIFDKFGEQHFRKLEKEALMAVSKAGKNVVSCGGGIMLDDDNIDIMHNTGVMICLKASPETLYKRLKGCKNRPLLNGPAPKERISELMKAREHVYLKADYSVDTDDMTVVEVAEKVMKIVNDK